MPVWIQIILGAGAVITALGVIWTKVIRPGFGIARTADEMLPLLKELTLVFRNNPSSFSVLEEISGQFRTDSGSSLRDVVNRLDNAAIAQAATTQALMIIVTEVLNKANISADGSARVASDLALAQIAVEGVAADLAASHARADEIVNGTSESTPGEAADAASANPIEES